MEYLYDTLLKYQKSDMYPFHMPGHKRKKEKFENPFQIDLTEIYGFDNLHHAEGILKTIQERAAALYGAEETHFLINGSTCGILSAVAACTTKRGKILMARNCHKAAYHAALLGELEVEYICPEREDFFGINGGICPETVERMLEQTEGVQAVMITSPTYDGVVSDIKKIGEIVHRKGIPFIVDEAHGAHFGFHPYFPESSVRLGADLVIHSLHKTLPSLTQTALLHVNGNLVNREKLQMYLGIYQSSSPSYVLMAGMDECIREIMHHGVNKFERLKRNLDTFYKKAEEFSGIRLAGYQLVGKSGIYDFDRSKLILSVKNTEINGSMLSDRLREEYHLEMEMAAGTYALALTSIADTDEGFARLIDALKEIDGSLKTDFEKKKESGKKKDVSDLASKNEIVYRISDAMEKTGKNVLLKEAENKVSREFLYLYPPGIPLLTPGERIGGELLNRILNFRQEGYSIQGLADYQAEYIQVISEENSYKKNIAE